MRLMIDKQIGRESSRVRHPRQRGARGGINPSHHVMSMRTLPDAPHCSAGESGSGI